MVMKKGCFVISLLVLMLFSESVLAVNSIGVSPSSAIVKFVPGEGYKGSFDFNFVTDDPNAKLEIYLEGDLIEYVTIDPKTLNGGGEVRVSLDIPGVVEKPGPSKIYIGARGVSEEDSRGGGFGIGVTAGVMAVVRVDVPYPGKYADIRFEIEDANAGEKTEYKLRIDSRGKESIDTISRVIIYNSRNESVKTFSLGGDSIAPADYVEINSDLDVSELGSGNYWAEAVVTYSGEDVKASDNFRLGELRVDIVNYTRELKKNELSPFFIDAESFWNDPIDGLFAEVSVVGTDITFSTPSVNLKPWQRVKLRGFIDTSELESDEGFQANIVLFYGDKTTEELVDVSFIEESNFIFYILIAVGIVVIIVVGFFVIRKIKSGANNGKKKKNKK